MRILPVLILVTALVAGGIFVVIDTVGWRAYDRVNSALGSVSVRDIALESYPSSIGVAPWGEHELYVSVDEELIVFDQDVDNVAYSIELPDVATGLSFDDVNHTVWTTCVLLEGSRCANVVSVIDTQAREVIQSITFDRPVFAVAVDSDLRRAFVVNRPNRQGEVPDDESWVSVVDTDTYQIIAEYRIPLAAYAIRIDQTTHMGFIGGRYGTAIFATQTPGTLQAPDAIAPSGSSATNTAIDEEAHRAYIATDDEMVSIDTWTGDELGRASLETAINDMIVGRDGLLWTVDSQSNRVAVYDPKNWSPVTNIAVGEVPVSITEDPESGSFYVGNNWGYSISVISPDE